MKHKVMIAGATGLVGRRLVQNLCDHPNIEHIESFSRRQLKICPAKLRQRPLVFSEAEKFKTARKADLAFCSLGTTIKEAGSAEAFRAIDFDLVLRFAQFAKSVGAQHFFLVSAVGANVQAKVNYSRVKGEAEQAITQLGFTGVHFFRPSFLLGQREQKRPAEAAGIILAKAVGWSLVAGLKKYKSIKANDVARAMLAAALRGEAGVHVYEFAEMQSSAKTI